MGVLTAHPASFVIVGVYVAAWLIFDPGSFDWHAIATIATWLMTLIIQRAEHRDTQAIHAKLDELLRVEGWARRELTELDDEQPEMIKQRACKNAARRSTACNLPRRPLDSVALPTGQQFDPVGCGTIMGCNTQLLIGLVQEDSRCLIAPALVIAMATPVDQQHNSLRVERGEQPSCDCCNIAGGQEIQHLRQHDQIEAAVGPFSWNAQAFEADPRQVAAYGTSCVQRLLNDIS